MLIIAQVCLNMVLCVFSAFSQIAFKLLCFNTALHYFFLSFVYSSFSWLSFLKSINSTADGQYFFLSLFYFFFSNKNFAFPVLIATNSLLFLANNFHFLSAKFNSYYFSGKASFLETLTAKGKILAGNVDLKTKIWLVVCQCEVMLLASSFISLFGSKRIISSMAILFATSVFFKGRYLISDVLRQICSMFRVQLDGFLENGKYSPSFVKKAYAFIRDRLIQVYCPNPYQSNANSGGQ